MTNVNFLLMISIQYREIRLWELIKWSPKGKCLDLLSNSLNSFMEGNVCRSVWRICMCILGLKGLRLNFIWNRWDLYQFSFLALEKHWETTQTLIKKSMLFSVSCERHLPNVCFFFFFRNWLRGRRWRRSLIFTFAQQASHICGVK